MATYNVRVDKKFKMKDEDYQNTVIYKIASTIEKYVLNIKTLSTLRVTQQQIKEVLEFSSIGSVTTLLKKLGINVRQKTESKSREEKIQIILESCTARQIIRLQAYAQELNINQAIQKAWKEVEHEEELKKQAKKDVKEQVKKKVEKKKKSNLDKYLASRNHLSQVDIKTTQDILLAKARAMFVKDANKYVELEKTKDKKITKKYVQYQIAYLMLSAIKARLTITQLEALGQKANIADELKDDAQKEIVLSIQQALEIYEQQDFDVYKLFDKAVEKVK